MLKRVIAIGICILTIFNLVGCTEKVENYENEPLMTDVEYKEFVLNQERAKVVSQRDIELNYIDLYDVPEDVKDIIYTKVLETLKDLNKNIGFASQVNLHENFKLLLDNLIQTGQVELNISTNSGYYYATIKTKFDKNPKLDGLKKVASYVGIKGAIGYDLDGTENVDVEFLKSLVELVNAKRAAEGLDPVDTEIEQIDYLSDFNVEDLFTDEELLSKIGELDEEVKEDNSKDYEEYEKKDNIFEGLEDQELLNSLNVDQFNRTIRRLNYDADEFNDIGAAVGVESIVPNINALFSIQSNEDVSGYSLYSWGDSIPELNGNTVKDVELTFIYKFNIDKDDYELVSYYPYSITSNVIIEEDPGLVTGDFIQKQLKIALEEFNCGYKDKSLVTLTSGNLIYPQDLGLQLLKYRDSIDLLYNTFQLDKVLRRDDNTYLCRVWQISTEGIKAIDSTGARFYREWLMRFKIEKARCYISDMYLTKLKCLRIPASEIDRGSLLKLHSSENISVSVPEELKEELRTEFNKLASGLTYVIPSDMIREDGTIMKDEGTGIEAWGYESRFNPDNTVMTDKERNDAINLLATNIVKYGVNVRCKVYINSGQWLWSANNNQVALAMNILYDWGDKAQICVYNTVYSKFKDVWVIDEIKQIEGKIFDYPTKELRTKAFSDMGIGTVANQ